MTAISPEIEHLDLTEMVEDVDVPCEWSEFTTHRGAPATWIVWLKPCPTCGRNAMTRLICDDCKRSVCDTDEALLCGACGSVFAPGRHIVKRLERINKRAA